MIRRATIDDLDAIINFTRPYFDESFWGKNTVYSEFYSRQRFADYIINYDSFLIDDGELLGMATLGYGYYFTSDLSADIEFFFIRKDLRGSGLSRLLRDFCAQFAKNKGAIIMLAGGASGVSDGLWQNLFKKAGFMKLGTLMAKRL